jgi:hypothetical protein
VRRRASLNVRDAKFTCENQEEAPQRAGLRLVLTIAALNCVALLRFPPST